MTEAKGSISIPVEELNKLRDGWALAIGRFLIAFTSCEYWTYLYIRTFGSERMREATSDLNIRPRADIALALLSDLKLTNSMQHRVDAAFKKLEGLSVKRNLIAHNSPMVHVYRDEKTGKPDVRHELRSARDPIKSITIAELEKLYTEANELDEEMALLYGLVRQSENRSS
jgi:hypothetical protein